MAEGFEPYHVPQQSRRDKLRVGAAAAAAAGSGNLQGCAGLLPLYDPSLLPSDLLSCAHPSSSSHHHHHQHHNNNNSFSHHHDTDNDDCVVKEERANLMNYVGIGLMMNNASSSSSASASQQHQHIPYSLDPQSMNPNSIHDINNHFLYNLRDFNHHHHQQQQQSFVYKPEPLSLTQGGHNGNIGHVHGQGLSLSLSSHQNNNNNNNNNNLLPLELNLQRYDSPNFGSSSYVNVPNNNNNNNIAAVVVGGVVGGGSVAGAGTSTASHDVWRSSVPLGPFTGYASILKKSRFLKPAHQLLEEFCDVGPRGIYLDKIAAAAADDGSLMDPCSIENLSSRGGGDDNNSLSFGGDLGTTSTSSGGEHRGKKSRLISMLEEVFRRYKQYYQQMQAVVSSFETVAGLTNAAPYANLALKAMSKHFRCLKNAITEQLQFTNKVHGHMGGKDEVPKLGTSDRVGFYGERPVQNSGYHEHQPVWRPQRGLPERAVTVLRAWLFEHFLHPYPTDTDKLMLAKQTGLSRNQVSNWFINARVRLWKPMVEEIHMLETRQAPKTSPREDHQRIANPLNDTIHSANSLASENPSTSTQRFQDAPISKRTRNELPHHITLPNEEPMNLSYHNFPSHHSNLGVGVSTAAGSSGVSLTLGLHQNNGIGLPEPYPINAAQRFGLDANNDGYVMGGFDAQSRHFGRDVIGSQLLHDFVG